MAKFYALQVIMGKIKFAKVPTKIQDAVLEIIDERGFYIDDNGDCKVKPLNATDDEVTE